MKPSFHRKLDLRGLHCPQPVLNCRAALAGLPVGEVLYVMATEQGVEREIRSLVLRHAHVLEAQWEAEGLRHFLIRKTEPGLLAPRWMLYLLGDEAITLGYLQA